MINKLLNALFPSTCPICEGSSDAHLYNPICAGCWGEIQRYNGGRCRICGKPTDSLYTASCAECLKRNPPFSRIIYYGIYKMEEKGARDALSEAIRLYKYNRIRRLSLPLSKLICSLGDTSPCSAIIPVPLFKRRLIRREFNQSALISRHLSRHLKIPLMLHVLRRIRDTKPQASLAHSERLKNVKGAFKVFGDVKGLDLLLVDDIVTTASTASECSSALMVAGAKSVTVAALARASHLI
ncbi:MAG: ComF family protein [Nitrospirae bacterium]|nr:ComF family protein [Nitrospirota bacterium]